MLHSRQRTCAAFFACLSAGVPAGLAQHQAALIKQHRFVQTGADTVAEDPAGPPWRFQVLVDGNAAGLSFAAAGGTWQPVSLSPNSGNYEFAQEFPVAGAVDAVFPDGRFALALNGMTVPLRLDGGDYPDAPVAEASAGRWEDGVLVVDPARAETITLRFAGGYAPGRAYLAIAVGPRTGIGGYSDRVSSAGPGAIDFDLRQRSLTIPANSLAGGATYRAELVLYRCTSVDQSSLPGLAVIAAYSTATTFVIRAEGSAPESEAVPSSFRPLAEAEPLRLR